MMNEGKCAKCESFSKCMELYHSGEKDSRCPDYYHLVFVMDYVKCHMALAMRNYSDRQVREAIGG